MTQQLLELTPEMKRQIEEHINVIDEIIAKAFPESAQWMVKSAATGAQLAKRARRHQDRLRSACTWLNQCEPQRGWL